MMMINLIGLLVIALIVWWFWLYKPAEVGEKEKEKEKEINFLPKDPSTGDEDGNL
jgi:plastocyanin domain-containing protein